MLVKRATVARNKAKPPGLHPDNTNFCFKPLTPRVVESDIVPNLTAYASAPSQWKSYAKKGRPDAP